MPNYNPLDDALTLIGSMSANEDITDEDALSMLRAHSEDDLEALVLVLAGIASGLALSISDTADAPRSAVPIQFASTREEVEGAATNADGAV